MSDNLAIINRVIEEHQTIRAYVKLAGDSTSDQEALMALTKMRPDWIPGQLDILTEKQNKLEQVLSSLQEGLRHHFDFEETALPRHYDNVVWKNTRDLLKALLYTRNDRRLYPVLLTNFGYSPGWLDMIKYLTDESD